MLSITLAYTSASRYATPSVLYAGNDATAAESVFLDPPAGFIRTELIKAPLVTRRRVFPAIEEQPASPAPTPAKKSEKSEKSDKPSTPSLI